MLENLEKYQIEHQESIIGEHINPDNLACIIDIVN